MKYRTLYSMCRNDNTRADGSRGGYSTGGQTLIQKQFNPEMLYNKIVHYYIDKKGYTKEKANSVAQRVIEREALRRTCKDAGCGHSTDDHIRNSGTCLVLDCDCRQFVGQHVR